MIGALKKLLKPLASLRLTVVLLALSMLLIFAGTWAQIDSGIWDVQHRYFHSFFTWIDFQLFLKRPAPGQRGIPGGFPMLGGYSLILLLLVNLLAAHTVRFKLSWRRSGIFLIHGGLILLLVGEGVTSLFAVERQMVIDEGSSANYTQDVREPELAIVDPTPADHDNVTVIPASRLARKGTVVRSPALPFDVKVEAYYENSEMLGPAQARARDDSLAARGASDSVPRATAGHGVQLAAEPRPKVTGTQSQKIDAASAYVTLEREGKNLGTYLVSLHLLPDTVVVDGRPYEMELRFKRHYTPYTVHLIKFDHDRYVGTNVARNFSSRVRLVDPTRNEDREALIRMNHPLRYAGETFFQQSFFPGDKTSVLQVVRNPGWPIPYVSCAMGALGMLIHFGIHLMAFIRRRRAADEPTGATAHANDAAPPRRDKRSRASEPRPVPELSYAPVSRTLYPSSNRAGRLVAGLIVACCALYVLASVSPSRNQSGFDLNTFGRLPVSYEGRTMPLDTLARNGLRIVSGRSQLRDGGEKRPAIQWLLEVMSGSERAMKHEVLRIDHPDLLAVLSLDSNRKLFSVKEVLNGDNQRKLQEQLDRATAVDEKLRDLYQQKVVELAEHVTLLGRLAELSSLFLVPPLEPGESWRSVTQSMRETETGEPSPALRSFMLTLKAYDENRPAEFNSTAGAYLQQLDYRLPEQMRKVRYEAFFNKADPFYRAMILYVLAFVLACVTLLLPGKLAKAVYGAALGVIVVALVAHTFGLASRIYISGRPPVTNLYSSAVFIAFGGVILATLLEAIYRNGIGALIASTMGFSSLLIAYFLSASGDTMHQLVAVLDTNFWLATHVVVITLGYTSTFLAALVAIVFVIAGVATPAMRGEPGKDVGRMVYGIVCFATLFSFVGTILGGIWADQSWGRFWGWDPKENGAVLIVLWNALILHARWGGLVKLRGMMLLAIFGGIVTSWSWFGTNMLGIGLHSYGFMNGAMWGLVAFVLSQIALIGVGLIPLRFWRSFSIIQDPVARARGFSVKTSPALG